MNEIIIGKKKNGMTVMLLTIVGLLAAIALVIIGGILLESSVGASPLGVVMLVVGIVWFVLGWIPFVGLKVLKPQEALVLTLFGNYIGTIK
ncbi:MAG: SPFH domain-containing protein, partial [Candidatus Flemingiibacterium sp.]